MRARGRFRRGPGCRGAPPSTAPETSRGPRAIDSSQREERPGRGIASALRRNGGRGRGRASEPGQGLEDGEPGLGLEDVELGLGKGSSSLLDSNSGACRSVGGHHAVHARPNK